MSTRPSVLVSSLAALIGAILLVVVTLILGVFAVIDYTQNRDQVVDQFSRQIETSTAQLASGLALPLWYVDSPQIIRNIESLMRDPQIAAVYLSTEGHTYHYVRDAQGRSMQSAAPYAPVAANLELKVPITFMDRPIGTLIVSASRDIVEKQLNASTRKKFEEFLVFDLILIAVLYASLRIFVIKPLRVLQSYAASISFGATSPVDPRQGDRFFLGEVRALRDSLLKMFGLLDSRYQELQTSEERLKLATQAAAIGVWDWNVADNVLSWDESMYIVYGIRKEDFGGAYEAWSATLHPADRAFVEGEVQAALRGEREYEPEFRIIRRDGATLIIKAASKIIRDSTGTAVRMIGTNIDITGRKIAELELAQHRDHLEKLVSERTQALAAARDQAESASRAKSEFLSNMSHEIRTPMNAIMGMTRLALKNETDIKQRNYLEKIDIASRGLLGIINDILDFSKIEAGKLTFEDAPYLLDEVLTRLTDLIVMKAQEKGLELLFDIDPQTPTAFIGDAMRLGQILLNLLNNAVKFTERGEITLRVLCLEHDADRATLQFEVRDTGIGMTPEQSARLFTAFEQADSSTTRRFGGTGLGLSISEKLVGLMGGRIWVETGQNLGSRFFFTLPLRLQPDQARRQLPTTHDMRKLRILVVDDNQGAREIMMSILSSLELNAEAVESANACIAALAAAQATGQAYDLVLMDWQMPGMNGVEAVRAIQADPRLSPTVTFVMVTAYSRDELLAQVNGVKIAGLLEKPVSPSSVFDVVATALGMPTLDHAQHRYQRTAVPQESAALIKGARALLVEDNEMNQDLALDFLGSVGMEVDLARNGAEAVEHVARKNYDVILMDCQMPVMDGFEATRRIRADVRNAELPILAMTANAMVGDKEKCRAAGMNEHISKPIDLDQLLVTLVRWIKPRAANQPRMREAPAATGSGQVPALPGVDSVAALRRLRGNEKLYLKQLAMFRDGQADAVERIRQAWDKGDRHDAQFLAHSLKGPAGNIGADRVYEAANELELAIKNDHGEQFEVLLEQLAAPLYSLVEALNVYKARQVVGEQ